MKMKYNSPEINIEELMKQDVLCTSGLNTGNNGGIETAGDPDEWNDWD